MNTNAWTGWSQFNKPQNNTATPTRIPAARYPMLIENEATYSGGNHWDFAPSTRFFWIHNRTMNTLYFDGHVGAIRSAQLITLYTGEAP